MTALMVTGEPRLAIDYGAVTTRAVVTSPDGRWLPLLFDGVAHLPSAVFATPDGHLLTGAQAWQRADSAPEGFEPAPKRRITEATMTLGARTVDVADLIAATLRRVSEQATAVAGDEIGDVRLVVPASWGPHRRTLLRQAARRAGLPQPTLVETPVAVAEHLAATGVAIGVGTCLAVCDFGAGFEAAVVRRTDTGFEVLSALDAPHAGGARVDTTLADDLTAITNTVLGSIENIAHTESLDGRWTLVDNARVAKESLAHAASIAVPMPPPRPPVVLDAARLSAIARPVLHDAADVANAAIDAAGVPAAQLLGVYCVGGGAHLPATTTVLRERLTIDPTVVTDPQLAAVRGAARTTDTHTPTSAPPPDPGPPIRRTFSVLTAAVASLTLVAHAYGTAHYERQTGGYTPYSYLLANWGELAMAATFALVAALAAATLIAATLPAARFSTRSPGHGPQIGTALLAAVALGLAVAGLYAIAGAVYFHLPNGPFLRWAVLPLLPMAAIATLAAFLITRARRSPGQSWDSWLAFSPTSVICAAAGMLLLQYSITANLYPTHALLGTLAAKGGGLFLGIGAALALASTFTSRLILAMPLAVYTAAIASWPATGILGIIYITAATAWWTKRIWHLLRQQPTSARL